MGDEYDDLYGDLYGDDSAPAAGSASAAKPAGGAQAGASSSSSTSASAAPAPAPSAAAPAYGATSDPRARPATSTIASVTGQQGYPQQQQYHQQQHPPQQGQPGPGMPPTAHDKYKMSDQPDAAKMFIGGLNWDTTDESLRSYFEKFGAVQHSTIMRDAETGRSRGFAFLTFEDPASVESVLSTEHYLDGKTIDPKRAIPKSEGAKTDKIFVRSIPPSITQERFRQYWRQFPGLADATLMMDRETGKHRGFGFVNYESSEAVDRVLASGPHYLDDQQLEVKRAQQRPEAQRGGPGGRFGGGPGGPHGGQQQQQFGPYGVKPPGGAGAGAAAGGGGSSGGFDPTAMANFFQQMGWGAFNPMMMGMGMPMMNPMMMPGQDGSQGAAATGAADPSAAMMGMGMQNWQNPMMQQGGAASGSPPGAMGAAGRGGRGGGRGGGPGRGGFSLPSGPASMRGSGQDGGVGPSRSRGGGPGYHPYQR